MRRDRGSGAAREQMTHCRSKAILPTKVGGVARSHFAGSIRCLLACTMLLPSAAHAQFEPQTPTGSRISKDPEAVEPQAARLIEKDFATCVFSRNPELVTDFLAKTDPGSTGLPDLGFPNDEVVEAFGMVDCLGDANRASQSDSSMAINVRRMRSLVAEEAYLARHDSALVISDGGEEVLSNRVFSSSNNAEVADDARVKAAIADCVIFNAPTHADALLRTAPASEAERQAVQALIPALSNCIVEGQEVTLTAVSIRAIVADGLWARSYYGAAANDAAPASAAAPNK